MLTSQEAVELHEQLEVDIVTLWGLSVCASHMVSVEIDTYSENPSSAYDQVCSLQLVSRHNLLRRVKISPSASVFRQ